MLLCNAALPLTPTHPPTLPLQGLEQALAASREHQAELEVQLVAAEAEVSRQQSQVWGMRVQEAALQQQCTALQEQLHKLLLQRMGQMQEGVEEREEGQGDEQAGSRECGGAAGAGHHDGDSEEGTLPPGDPHTPLPPGGPAHTPAAPPASPPFIGLQQYVAELEEQMQSAAEEQQQGLRWRLEAAMEAAEEQRQRREQVQAELQAVVARCSSLEGQVGPGGRRGTIVGEGLWRGGMRSTHAVRFRGSSRQYSVGVCRAPTQCGLEAVASSIGGGMRRTHTVRVALPAVDVDSLGAGPVWTTHITYPSNTKLRPQPPSLSLGLGANPPIPPCLGLGAAAAPGFLKCRRSG